MKRVLMLGYFFPPSKAAGTFRSLRFVRDLPRYGWQPHVLTVSPGTYPESDAALLHKVPNEVEVSRTPAPPYHRWFKNAIQNSRSLLTTRRRPAEPHERVAPLGPPPEPVAAERSSPRRLPSPGSVSEWLYTALRTPDIDAGWYPFALLRGLELVLRKRPDVLYATGGPWTTFLVARDLARWSGVPLVLDYRDPWTHNPAVKRGGGLFERIAERLEASAVRSASRVVANTDVLRDTLITAHGDAVRQKTVIIHNSYEADDYDAPEPPKPETFTFCYVGSLYDAHSPEAFLRSLLVLFEKRPTLRGTFRVRLVGSGAPRTQQMVLGLGLDDVVEVHAPVSHAEAIRLQRSSHALLLFLTVDSDHSTFIPSKLFEYIAARRPILAVTRGGALQRLLERRDITPWVYQPNDIEGIADGVATVLERHVRGDLPVLADDVVRSFSGHAAARALAGVLEAARSREPLAPIDPQQQSTDELQPAGTE